ncbi:MAG: carboxypeptidase-like regulatory domain-containing protein, partial [Thermoproteota archaeon]
MNSNGYLSVVATTIIPVLLLASIFAVLPVMLRAENAMHDLTIKVVDQSSYKRLISGATVVLTTPSGVTETAITTDAGEATFTGLPTGIYTIEVSANSRFGTVTTKQEVELTETTTVIIQVPLYDVVLKLVSPRGTPLVAADIKIGNFEANADSTGSVIISQIPAGSYPLTITWLGADVSPAMPLNVVLSSAALTQTYTVTASKIATVTVQVLGAQNQGLSGATV